MKHVSIKENTIIPPNSTKTIPDYIQDELDMIGGSWSRNNRNFKVKVDEGEMRCCIYLYAERNELNPDVKERVGYSYINGAFEVIIATIFLDVLENGILSLNFNSWVLGRYFYDIIGFDELKKRLEELNLIDLSNIIQKNYR